MRALLILSLVEGMALLLLLSLSKGGSCEPTVLMMRGCLVLDYRVVPPEIVHACR